MRKLIIVALVVALAAVIYVKYFGGTWPWASEKPLTKANAMERLSSLVDAYIDSIFSPLDASMPPGPGHSLNQLRALLADGLATAPASEQHRYRLAVQLCDTLLSAIRERESCNLRLASSKTKPYAVGMTQNQVSEEEQKRAFFEGAITLSWAETSRKYREQVNKLYRALRAQERSIIPASVSR